MRPSNSFATTSTLYAINKLFLFFICFILFYLSKPIYAQYSRNQDQELLGNEFLFEDSPLDEPVGLAFDTLSRRLFIADRGANAIFSYSMDQKEWTTLVQNRNMEPEYIDIYPDYDLIVWTDQRT